MRQRNFTDSAESLAGQNRASASQPHEAHGQEIPKSFPSSQHTTKTSQTPLLPAHSSILGRHAWAPSHAHETLRSEMNREAPDLFRYWFRHLGPWWKDLLNNKNGDLLYIWKGWTGENLRLPRILSLSGGSVAFFFFYKLFAIMSDHFLRFLGIHKSHIYNTYPSFYIVVQLWSIFGITRGLFHSPAPYVWYIYLLRQTDWLFDWLTG